MASHFPGVLVMAGEIVVFKNKVADMVRRYVAPTPADGVATADASREIRLGWWLLFGFFGVFLGWAALARVDAAVMARGTIVVSGSLQEVQHKTGGVVSKLLVREGAHVQKGQVLLELAGDQSEAAATSLTAQYITLKVQEARLMAAQGGASSFEVPLELRDYTGVEKEMVDEAMRLQLQALRAAQNALGSQISVLGQQQGQTAEQIAGAKQRIAANLRQQDLTRQELAGVDSLEKRGFAPKTRVRELESRVAGLEGENGALNASVAQANAAIGESRMRMLTLRQQYFQDLVTDLRDTQLKLSNIVPQMTAANTEFDRVQVRAPVTGKVLGLTAHTVGGVIAPGDKILSVVPDKAPLVIDAYILPQDGDDIRIGQETRIRFSGLYRHDLPDMKGKVIDVSGDSFTDPKTGQAFFKAKIQVAPESMALLRKAKGWENAVKPGIPVDVNIPTRKRTVLTYLLEPLNETFSHTFTEH